MKRFRIHAAATGMILIFSGGCAHPKLKDSCGQEWVQFEQRFENLELGLAPWQERGQDKGLEVASRSPASSSDANGGVSIPKLSDRDRKSLSLVARASLDQVQRYIDLSLDDPKLAPVNRQLVQLADMMVSLHAYAENGKLSRMFETLDSIRERAQKARRLLCGD